VVGGVGLAGLAVGGVLAFRARSLNKDSLSECRDDDVTACTPQGVELREDAQKNANLATIFMIAGGALVSTGFVLIVAAPSSQPGGLDRVQLEPEILPGAAALRLRSVWW
jgi:hypothetical protein